MSTLIALNNTAPGITPSGCSGGIGDIATPAYAQMSINGSTGTSPISGSGVGLASITSLYYIGVVGQYNAGTINSGTWNVPIYLNSATHALTLQSIYIYRANSSGVGQTQIGSLTGIGTSLTVGSAQSFNVSGISQTFGTGDIVVVSFQFTAASSGTSFTILPNQTVTAPSSSIPTGGAVPVPRVGGWYKRRLPFVGPIPSGISSPSAPSPSPPTVVRRKQGPRRGTISITPVPRATASTPSRGPLCSLVVRAIISPLARVVITQLPRQAATVSYKPLPSTVTRRGTASREGKVYLVRVPLKAPAAAIAGPVPRPIVVSLRQEVHEGHVRITRVPRSTAAIATSLILQPVMFLEDRSRQREKSRGRTTAFFASIPLSATGTSGPILLLKSGPLAHIPNLRFREPGFTSDSFQLFIGNGTGDTFIGGMSSVPSSSTSAGYPGEYSCDSTYFYFCYSANHWLRVAMSTF